ncbi:GNAT family N-acetyltransferase [Actinopolymorpha sp. NPDC004070]|uniref:GNAT family N-acetyltransferase n=1 Tax=Actinopolymorpha sp. NPDC004070 TaxID=3154548 RepID=UPI0033BA2353
MLLEERPPTDAGLSALLTAAFDELVKRNGPEGRSAVHAEARYLVALVEAQPVGCGAIQPAGAATAELKRMYVIPSARGQGVARALLAGLEDLARGSGLRVMRLATGVRQPEAIGLYESSGYAPTEPYGKYVGQPLTRCYEKVLTTDGPGSCTENDNPNSLSVHATSPGNAGCIRPKGEDRP